MAIRTLGLPALIAILATALFGCSENLQTVGSTPDASAVDAGTNTTTATARDAGSGWNGTCALDDAGVWCRCTPGPDTAAALDAEQEYCNALRAALDGGPSTRLSVYSDGAASPYAASASAKGAL